MIDLPMIIQGVSIVIIGGAIKGLMRQANELTRLSTIIVGLEKRLERLEGKS